MTGKKPTPEVIAAIAGKKVALDLALTHEHRMVWSHARNAGFKDFCVIQDDEITAATGLTLERIDDILDDLQSLGYLKREGYATRGGNPEVKLTVPWVPAATRAKIDAWIEAQVETDEKEDAA